MQLSDSDAVLKEKIDSIHRLADIIDRAEAELKELKKTYGSLETDLIDIFENKGLKTIKGVNGRGVTLVEPSLKFSPKAGQKEAMLKWLKENGYEYAVKEDIHHGTLNGQMTIRHADGLPIPEEIFHIFEVKKLRIS